MLNQKFKETLVNLLLTDTRLIDESGELSTIHVHEYANKLDPQLIEFLIDNEETRAKFFLKIKDVYVFKQSDFKFFLDENKIDNSYTQYENKIGLSFGSKLLRETSDVVLNFPYKDCVLEGGQSTEEGTDSYFEEDTEVSDYIEKKAKRKEIFFNQILARDEIDRLLEPKAFTNAKKYTKTDIEEITKFERDENGTIKDNLIIKGNNLLALHSLKKEFKEKVKLIYIDPPYNTGNDSFAYNDNFNHSTWLTFMKNRLEVARDLLKDDGVLIVQLDSTEAAYLKILADSVFGRENFVVDFIWKKGAGTQNDNRYVAFSHEFALCYAKNREIVSLYNLPPSLEMLRTYVLVDEFENERGKYKLRNLCDFSIGDRPGLHYDIECPDGTLLLGNENRWRCDLKRYNWRKSEGQKRIVFKKENNQWQVYYKQYLNEKKEEIVKDKNGNLLSYGRIPTSIVEDAGFTGDGKKDIKSLFEDNPFSYPKPVKLIQHFVQIITKNSDVILDFHAGSGTTGHAVVNLNKEDGGNRQFILVEQMDYADNITASRVQKVLKKENIDNSFVYLELAKNNQNAIEKIQEAENLEALMVFFEEMYEKYFLSYNVKIKEFKEKISQELAFKNLPLERQKQIFAKMLDLNQLYVNVSDMEDARYALKKSDLEITKDFYSTK